MTKDQALSTGESALSAPLPGGMLELASP